jgi:hypothetical protein
MDDRHSAGELRIVRHGLKGFIPKESLRKRMQPESEEPPLVSGLYS